MIGKRNSLLNQINEIDGGIQRQKKTVSSLNYEKIIQSQQEVIKLLQKEISYLRQYLIYVADFEETANKEEEKIDDSSSQEFQNSNSVSTEKTTKKINGLKALITEIMNIVEAKNPGEILPQLKIMEEKSNQKMEPVFIQRFKEKQIPVIIEKPVEKIVVQEKIVTVEKVVQVPVFKEKIVQKYIYKPSEILQKPAEKPISKSESGPTDSIENPQQQPINNDESKEVEKLDEKIIEKPKANQFERQPENFVEKKNERWKFLPETSEGSFQYQSPKNMKKKKSYVENKKGKWDHDETKHNYRSNKTTKYKEKEKY